jgi:uncharacterized protein
LSTETTILVFIAAGFLAQLIDGVMGMGYGVSLTSFLLALGIPPAAASASVHASEIFTSGVSGISHLSFKNVDFKLFKRLLIPGILGGVVGAYLLTEIPSKTIKPIISAYLLLMGVVIVLRALRKKEVADRGPRYAAPLALVGGFLDAIGGGGWGPVVTTNLVAGGSPPRTTIGSVNLAEFFVTVAESITFVLTIGLTNWKIILGLILGGLWQLPWELGSAVICRGVLGRSLLGL